jgi:hypothetical protein
MRYFRPTFKSNNRFHGDLNGNAMIFVVLVLFTLVCFFVFTIHIGQRFTNKVEMQNAADAAAISGAVWKARGFNLISIMNVSMSECLALIIMFKAFDSTVTYTKIMLPIQLAIATACCAIPYSAAICCPWKVCLNIENKLLKAYSKVNDLMKKTYSSSPKLLWKLMSGLQKVSKGVSYATSVISYLDASRIADRNGADAILEVGDIGYHAILWPYQYELPVEEGSFEEDLCDHTWNGGDGYSNYLCYDDALDLQIEPMPLSIDGTLEAAWLLMSCVLPPPIITYEAMKKFHYKSLCSSSSSGADGEIPYFPEKATIECGKCKTKNGKSTWEKYKIEVTKNECSERWVKEGDKGSMIEKRTFQNGQRPEGTMLDNGYDFNAENPNNEDAGPCKVCAGVTTEAPSEEGQPPRYFVEIWVLKSCIYEADDEDQEPIDVDVQDHSGDKKPPIVLKDDWEEEVKYTSLVLKRENEVSSSHLLGTDGKPVISLKSDMSGEMITYGEDGDSRLKNGKVNIPEKTWAVARAEVYNPGQADLFNQNWHAKLTPIDVKGIQTEFMGFTIELPDALTDLANDAVEEVWAH